MTFKKLWMSTLVMASLPIVLSAASSNPVKLAGWIDSYSSTEGDYELSTIIKLDLSALKPQDVEKYLSSQVEVYGEFVKKENGHFEFKASKVAMSQSPDE